MTRAQPRSRSFPRRYAATQRFTLGAPRSFAVSPDGRRVTFVRSRGGDDPVGCLWVMDVESGRERLLCDPRTLGADDDELPPEERARRERARESARGVVTYATDHAVTAAVFAVGPSACVVDVLSGDATVLPLAGPVVAPRLDRTGRRVAFVRDGALWVAERDGSGERCVARDDDPAVTWGLPEFIAAEEMGRMRGYWWSPDGQGLAAARVDESAVQLWHIGDPGDPATAPAAHRYPAAGTPNADVSLHLVDLDGNATPVSWDRATLPYLVAVTWRDGEPLTVVVQSRDQRRVVVMRSDDGGTTHVVREDVQRPWVEIVPGFPRWTADGRLVHALDHPTARRIAIDDVPVTPADLQVRRLVDVARDRIVFTASSSPETVSVWSCALNGTSLRRHGGSDGVTDVVVSADVSVIVDRVLTAPGATVTIHHPAGSISVDTYAETPGLALNAREVVLGERRLRGLLFLPNGHQAGDAPLPVLLDPYGGPGSQRVLRSHDAHLQSQWFADAGFAVLVVDGRGTPGRGPAWEHEVAGDLASLPLQDQVDGLTACAGQHPGLLDLDRVAIKGWSFGGYLAALAVLRRPDVFHAAIAGAPVADWSLYDTHYTERYLGLPQENPGTYQATSLLTDAASLERPLLLIHGLADDNVVAAHTLRLSRALLEAGRSHCVLPLSGVTHMTPQEVVAENLLLMQLDFLRTALERHDTPPAPQTP